MKNLRLKKPLIYILILLMVLMIFQTARVLLFDFARKNFTLGGTYTCKELPFDVMSFGIDGSDKFIYYHGYEQLTDNGTFTKVSDGIYTLNSSIFQDQNLVCYKKFPSESGFTVQINGVDCKFVQVNSVPTQIGKSADSNGASAP